MRSERGSPHRGITITVTGRLRLCVLLAALAALALCLSGGRVQAQDGSVPDKPTGLSTEASHDSVALAWDDPGDDSITHYEVFRRDRAIHDVGEFVTIDSNTGSATLSYTDDTVKPETRYVYRVKAVNQHGASKWSSFARANTPAAPPQEPDPTPTPSPTPTPAPTPEPELEPTPESLAPSGLSAALVVGGDGVILSWDAPAEDPGSVTGYEILRGPSEDALTTLVADTEDSDTSYTDASANEPGVHYTYRVKALRDGEKSQESNYASIDLPDDYVPDRAPEAGAALAPSGLSAALVVGGDGVVLSWDAPAEAAGSVTGYEILRGPSEDALTTLAADTSSTDTAYTDETATEAGETYIYQVKALRGGEKSQGSDLAGAFIPTVTQMDGEPLTVALQSVADDRAALIALYNSAGGANWRLSANWNTTEPLDTWHGVTTDTNGRVTRLDIWLNNLVGQIADELGDLSKLEYLDLRSNNLNGQIPSRLGDLASLTHLNLGGNKLTGAIPGALGGLSNLETLDLRTCGLSGEIPSELGDLSNLEYLHLAGNLRPDIPGSGLTGTIPSELGGLSNLLELYLDRNQLTGAIPDELGNLSSLRKFSITYNQLSGQIPSGLGGLSNVQELYLHYNLLTGEIPVELGDLSNLEYLDLSKNANPDIPGSGLTGEIPATLGSLSKLLNLRLSSNRLSGEIPSELGDLSSVGYMYLNENQLSGEIPASLGSLSSLIILHVNDNQLSGEIPDELDSLTTLEDLRLQENQLSGEIPDLSSLASLRILYLYDNQLSGKIPDTVGNLTNLNTLFLHRNQLGGEIPSGLRNLSKLKYVFLHENQLRGEIPAGLGDLTSLLWLILHKNQLSGEIPGELGSLNNLTYLYLSDNQLRGKIPVELSSLNNLQELYLHRNQLSGEIPDELGSLPGLIVLTLSNNQLTGPIPEALGNLKNLALVRFAGNSLTECVPEGLNYLLTAPDYDDDPAHDFTAVDANGDGDYDDEGDTPGLGLLFCGVGELAALKLSGVTLNPAFTNRRETYTGTAPYEVVSTMVTAELNRPEDAFTIKKDGDIYRGNDALPLIAGSSSPNVVTIEVTLPDGSAARTYTVVVTRKDRARKLVTVPRNWSLIPDGFGPGEQFRLLFVTAETRDADSSRIADYDAFVRDQAAAGHASIRSYSSKFRVVGSTEGFGARGHTNTTDPGVPIYYLNGEKIADNYIDFYDGSWDSVEPRNENGDVLTDVEVWTGTQSDGTCSGNCLGSEFTIVGRPEFLGDGLDGRITGASFDERFYALSPIFMVDGLPEATLRDSFKPHGSDINGIWSDGTTIWVVDDEFHNETTETIRAYRKSDKVRDAEKDITSLTIRSAGNLKPRGIWSNGMTIWVADSRKDMIFAYDKTTLERDERKDFNTLKAAGNNEPSGIWSNGMTMWVADPTDNKIYAYRMSDKSRDPAKDFDILSDNHNPKAHQLIRADNTSRWLDNTNPRGIWSDGTTMWVTNTLSSSTDRIYAYRMSDWSRDGAKDLILPTHDADAEKDNRFPRHIWSDGTDIYVSDGYSDRVFIYALP